VLPITNILVAVPQTQISLASARVTELKQSLQSETTPRGKKGLTVSALCKLFSDSSLIQYKPSGRSSVKKMLALLEEYIAALRDTEAGLDDPQIQEAQNYHMPTAIVSPNEWAEFDNVFQIHCPCVFMDSAVRDVRSFSLFTMTSIIKVDADNDTILLLLSRTKRIRIPHGQSVCLHLQVQSSF
jgi:hypothetical protein